ncbi:substrate-binding domain-containing protein [Bacillus sp. PS06]|uniref:substrate-binding domain-containing protein n=1 Tax=Bacillus sp. PS06 TaxID=2764176 RepID=UPI001783C4C2|nr:substrate-binding domain-containing protein [Bacillus sp. PS06]MBD8070598.1 substrate-binding domain-containing protein [Bacillus sp. PS06]
MKKLFFVYAILIAAFFFYLYHYQTSEVSTVFEQEEEGILGDIDEKYVMVTFQVGMDYWKEVLKGFEDAAEALNVSVEYRGATQYDVNEQITVLEQVIARKPAGIAVTAIHPEKLNATINKAIEAGIPVVLFDADAPDSRAASFFGTNNYNAGVIAANKMAELVGENGKVGVITLPKQANHIDRTEGFQETIEEKYPDIEVVAIKDGKADQLSSRQAALEIMNQHPDLKGLFITEANGGVGVGEAKHLFDKENDVKIISFDTDKEILDMVKNETISATIAQGTWNMGYWSLQYLFHLKHDLILSKNGRFTDEATFMTTMDTGVTVVTKKNVGEFYAK